MTLEDFAESVVAGWLPLILPRVAPFLGLAWHYISHYFVSRWMRGKPY